ncbi:SDR family NAD(P)-dependent oxidoreductase [Brevibacillus dissolubilis]|uniref:SDR family NAD(P)-dependent oxidoreductase n=1 Tax=Brevibacillus dissolubilis TaxID=1844116 RepID=UPI00111666ED|nr:SDR family oxidoreductase [Brevibacillus dissolubilis]
MKRFQNQVVIVTGAGKGIGRTVALMYAEQGASVVVAERNESDGQATVQAIQSAGGQAALVPTDVSRPDEIVHLMNETKRLYGRLDILINNAGLGAWTSPYDLTLEDWDYVIHTNLRGTFLCSREAAKLMRENGGGAIINMASTRAHMSEPNSEAYAASKGGIVSLTHALAVSLGGDGIRVNVISPGWIETGDYDALREIDHDQHPARRVGKPDDIGRACLYLTDPANDFVTGAEIVIDGGMTRKMIYVE